MEKLRIHSFFILILTITSSISFSNSAFAQIKKSKVNYVPGELIIRVKDGSITQASNGIKQMSLAQTNAWLSEIGALSSTPIFRNKPKALSKMGISKQAFSRKSRLERYLKININPDEPIEQVIQKFQSHPNIEYVEPNYIYHALATTNDPKIDELWGFNNIGQTGGNFDSDIDLFEAWEIETGSASTVVAVIDTGVDYEHKDLADNMWINKDEIPDNGIDDDKNGYVDDYLGWNTVDNNNDPMDVDTHGTHVAGTIGGVANNGIGVVGVAWNVQIMPIRLLGDGGGYATQAAEAIIYAVDNGAKIINASWGGPDASETIKEAIEYAKTNDVLFVAAAGNGVSNWAGEYIGIDNDSHSKSSYPSSHDCPNIIAVAATDHNDELTDFSNYGLTTVDVAAPGYNILSSVPGDKYKSESGTSMATPITAGLAALIYSQDPSLSAIEIKQRIMDSVDQIDSLQGKLVTGGRINAYTALNTNREPVIQANSEVEGYKVTVSGSITDEDGYITSAEINISGINSNHAVSQYFVLENNGEFSISFEDLDDDVYNVTIIATDDKYRSVEFTDTIMVGDIPNQIPTVKILSASASKPSCLSISGTSNDPDSYGSINSVSIKILGMGNYDANLTENGNWNIEVCDLLSGQYILQAIATDNFGADSLPSLKYTVEITPTTAFTDTLTNHVEAGRVQKYLYTNIQNEYLVTDEYKYLRDEYCSEDTSGWSTVYECDGDENIFTLYQCSGDTTWTDEITACGSPITTSDISLNSEAENIQLDISEESEYTVSVKNNGATTASAVYLTSNLLEIDCGDTDCFGLNQGNIKLVSLVPSSGQCEIKGDTNFDCSFGNLEATSSANVMVRFIAETSGEINIINIVTSAQTDTNIEDNTSSLEITINNRDNSSDQGENNQGENNQGENNQGENNQGENNQGENNQGENNQGGGGTVDTDGQDQNNDDGSDGGGSTGFILFALLGLGLLIRKRN